ncbi:hypothetical protein ACFE04_005902 [Oxalis oulophora]
MESQSQTLITQPLPLFFTFFITIYAFSYLLIFKSWSPKTRPEACSCIISFLHGTPAVFLSLSAITTTSSTSFSAANTHRQNTVLEYSIAYFLTDLIHYLIFYPNDILFIGHHVATLFVFLTCRYVTLHGACAILGLLIIAEVTSACQNAWTLAGLRKDDVAFAKKVYERLSLPFYGFYSVVRGLVGPYYVYKMTSFYYINSNSNSNSGELFMIPMWVWVSWVVVVVMAISVSILWVSNLWVDFFRNKRDSYSYGGDHKLEIKKLD